VAETNQKRLDAVRAGAADRKKRRRSAALHITLTEAERAEFKRIAEEHGMLDRELLVNAMRAFKTGTRRLEVVEARLVLLGERLDEVNARLILLGERS